MKSKKTLGIVLIIVALGIIGALHQFVFAEFKADWQNYNQQLDQLKSKYNNIVRQVKKEEQTTQAAGGEVAIVTRMEEVIRVINEQIQTAQNNFDVLNEQLKLIERFDPNVNYRNVVLNEIDRMKQLETNSQITDLNVLSSWGVNHGILEGRYGTGFHATKGGSIAYANNLGTKRVINPRQGTIEFWLKPDWDPTDTEVKHKCIFMGLTVQKLSRERLAAMAEELSTETRQINLAQILPPGPGPFPVEELIAIYKGEGPTLTFELRNNIQPPSTVTAYISNWKPDQWHHIGVVWRENQQALYINGQNKGVPFGGGTSIRDARDEEEMLFLGGGGMGMGMGMGMGGMMGGMGMGGMGMGGMGGMMGGMGYGMGGGMMGGRGYGGGTTTGQTLTTNISLPSLITGVYVGADEEGNFAADCTIDELHIRDGAYTSFTINSQPQRTNTTMMLDHFNEDLPEPSELEPLLTKLDEMQQAKQMPALKPDIRERYQQTYDMLKHAIGLDEDYLAENDPTMRKIRQLYLMEYIRTNTTGRSFYALEGLLEIDSQGLAPEFLHRIVEYQRLCYDIAQQATKDRLIAINEVINKGQGYNVDDKELRTFFRTRLTELQQKLFGEANIFLDYGLVGGGMGMGMGGGMMGGGMGMGGGMMGGMGGMGMMGGMGGMGMGGGILGMMNEEGEVPPAMLKRLELYDPEDDHLLSLKEKQAFFKKVKQMQDDFKLYMKYSRDELIPPQIIDEFNKSMEQSGEDYYIKRSLTLDFTADYMASMNYLYNLEYGPRINTINSITMENVENEIVNSIIDVESHFLKRIEEEQTAATGGEAIGMR